MKDKNHEATFEAILDGVISENARGENGFGFDEIFELESGNTLAQISTEEKLKISPRKKALEMVNKYIKNEMM